MNEAMNGHLLTGTVRSGTDAEKHPLARVRVTAYEATATDARAIGSGETDEDGRFGFHADRHAGGGIVYALAHVAPGVVLATVVGERIAGAVTINELTTVAAAFAMAQFTDAGAIRGDALALRIAAGMGENLVSRHSGHPSEVMLASPNADQTNSLRSIRTLGNLIAPCVRGVPGALDAVLSLTTPPRGPRPADTFAALRSICLHPAHNVAEIHARARELQVYRPSLERQPDAWTLAVKVNDSGDDTMMFGGPANIAWDRNGYAWIANNVFQGTPNSGNYIVVLKPDGRPADGADGTPRSPVTGGGICGPGFGICIDQSGHVWVGNYGWGSVRPENGSVSKFDPAGRPLSPPEGFISGTKYVQSTVPDGHGNMWLASYGNDSVVVLLGGDPEHPIAYPAPGSSEAAPGKSPFGIAIDPSDDVVWVTYSGGLAGPVKSTLAQFKLEGRTLKLLRSRELGSAAKGIALDSRGNVWFASGGDDSVYLVRKEDGSTHQFPAGPGGVNTPWSVIVDGDDDVWVANFAPTKPGSVYRQAAISKLAGVHSPSGLKPGEPISPASGYTLPSAGSPVLMHNGEPLYGPGSEPCFIPLLRQTNLSIDRAGNVWAINNWKPSFDQDVGPTGNPGGDGIVIFVGLARPPKFDH